ncbi:MAG TPA: hypothetical protein VNA25_14430, partial [Phycisphaerae bacterium]|nr:hypothetical protein [Phycisphaerae bacterium]
SWHVSWRYRGRGGAAFPARRFREEENSAQVKPAAAGPRKVGNPDAAQGYSLRGGLTRLRRVRCRLFRRAGKRGGEGYGGKARPGPGRRAPPKSREYH